MATAAMDQIRGDERREEGFFRLTDDAMLPSPATTDKETIEQTFSEQQQQRQHSPTSHHITSFNRDGVEGGDITPATGLLPPPDAAEKAVAAGAARPGVRFGLSPDDENENPNVEYSPTRDRQASFLGKLKALASSPSSTHARTASSNAGSTTPTPALSPRSERGEAAFPLYQSEAVENVETDAEADVDADSDTNPNNPDDFRPKKRRKSKRPALNGASESAPSTPRIQRFESRFASFLREQSHTRDGSNTLRPAIPRRNTTSEVSDDGARAGLSEDEGKDRFRDAFKRRLEGARGLSYAARSSKQNDGDPVSPAGGAAAAGEEGPRRPSHLRRITGLGGAVDGANTGSNFKLKADRQSSTSAQKWRQVKAGLKMLGQRKRDERMRVDHQKSAQLMAELLAGAPAALVFASMFQRDEHGHRKLPVLLEQLKISIPESRIREDKKGDRHLVFRVDLEYGSGSSKMTWTINRSLKDFVNLHVKYQSSAAADKVRHLRGDNKNKVKMPKFPRSAFPYARTIRGLFDNLQEEDEDEDPTDAQREASVSVAPATAMSSVPLTPGPSALHSTPDGTANARGTPATAATGPTPTRHRRQRSSFAPVALSRNNTGDLGPPPADADDLTARQRDMYAARQRRKLEGYLQGMIRWLIFRADSTRLCKFLELSAIAIRLSCEGGYQGKQGLLTIASRKHREMSRHTLAPQGFVDRHRPRWFLVRHSYIVCVDSPESLNPYDVFLVDSDFATTRKKKQITEQKSAGDMAKAVAENTHGKHLVLRLYNSERKLKLLARTERQFLQFQESIDLMAQSTVWSKKQRFDSFAPARDRVFCRWLVDGRDHMWQVSRAIDMAKDFIYIHDWWLSPELYMRRPAAISQQWRLDRLLLRKARQGVKIFVIIYRNIESAIPIDSEYTKWSLLDLDPNIMVQRSPNQFRQNQFFWAHHEKLVVIDNMMAFVGGVDLCFGRWDDPCHSLTDDKLTGFEPNFQGQRDTDTCQVWPGKDYSNPRVQDFYGLDRPYEEMYDRTKVPRMPWHDISMQIIGQPARDVARHFVQRWNYILRSRIPSRPTPVLLPPPEFEYSELEKFGMTGTCQIQILRSCSPWSIGTPNKVEHSIMNAYVHLIQTSEHFVYVENQFYISSCTVEGSTIHNKVGDALVERAIRAHENDENWQACLVIPLIPGFQNEVDSQDGTSVRLIMQCQYRSICRGETSIFGRLRAKGIEPEDYIRFYSLRQWGKIGPRKCLTTEQLYIHAKCMVVDDRHVIIGSANINERSMLGSRDSEVAALVTDTKMLRSVMGGKPYEVGEFAHTLRVRLMREHLGVDVDAIYRREQLMREKEEQDREMDRIYRDDGNAARTSHAFVTPPGTPPHLPTASVEKGIMDVQSGSHPDGTVLGINAATSASETDHVAHPEHNLTFGKHRIGSADLQHDLDVEGYGIDNMRALLESGAYGLTDSYIDSHGHEVLVKKNAPGVDRIKHLEDEHTNSLQQSSKEASEERISSRPPWPMDRTDTYALGLAPRSQLPELPSLDDTDIGGPPLTVGGSSSSGAANKVANPLMHSLRRPEVHEDCMTDPLALSFYQEIWNRIAQNNTKIYRQVFHCMPDSEVLDWRTYERFNDYNERFMQSQGLGGSGEARPSKDAPDKSGPPGSVGTDVSSAAVAEREKAAANEASSTRARSKSVIGGVVDKLRPRSRTVDEKAAHPPELTINEKDPEKEAQNTPGSPRSDVASSVPTAVPSPQPGPLDEKEAQKLADQQHQHQIDGSVPSKDGNGNGNGNGNGKDEDAANFTRQKTVQYSDQVNIGPEAAAIQTVTSTATSNSGGGAAGAGLQHTSSQKRRKRTATKSSAAAARHSPEEIMGRDEAEDLLKLVQGHLVDWPYDWLEKEERGGNWLYNIDQLAPLEIYD